MASRIISRKSSSKAGPGRTRARGGQYRGRVAPIALAVACVGGLAFGLVAQRDSAQSVHHAAVRATVSKSRTLQIASAARVAPGDRRPLSYYTQSVRGSLFEEPVPPAPKPVRIAAPKPVKSPIVPVEAVNPFSEWAYTGTVHIGDKSMALIENTKTEEGQYVEPGGSFMGATVTGISDGMVSLRSSGRPYVLAKATESSLVPLDKSADYLTQKSAPPDAQPNPGQNGMPAMNGWMPPGGWGGFRGRRGGGGGGGFRGGFGGFRGGGGGGGNWRVRMFGGGAPGG